MRWRARQRPAGLVFLTISIDSPARSWDYE